MKPYPGILDLTPWFNIDSVMTKALKLTMTFRIRMWDGTTRVIPSTVYLGHDSQFLYVGGRFVGMGGNPSSEPNGWLNANDFKILFDVSNKGVLRTPEAGSLFDVFITSPGNELLSHSWDDVLWAYADDYKRMVWMPAQNYNNGQGVLNYSLANHVEGYDNSTGTITILFSRYLNKPEMANIDALQMKPGERWVMGFLIELGFMKEWDDRVDGWPRPTYGVWSNDSSWWPKLAIDLSNPPTTYPGVPA
jgi:hypothetical protein